jgi:hypothetical protein
VDNNSQASTCIKIKEMMIEPFILFTSVYRPGYIALNLQLVVAMGFVVVFHWFIEMFMFL